MKSRAWISVLLVWLLIGAACTSDRNAEPTSDATVEYFEAWAAALSRNDFYGILDFYTANATVEDRTGVFRDATPPIRDLLRGNTAELNRELLDVYVGGDQAVAVVRWPDYQPGFGASLVDIADGLISRETVLLDAASLGGSLRASPETVEVYESFYVDYATAWSGDEIQRVRDLYAPGVVILDPLHGDLLPETVSGDAAAENWTILQAADLSDAASDVPPGMAVMIDPPGFGDDPGRAIGVFEVEDSSGCVSQSAIYWRFAGGLIVAEDRFRPTVSPTSCETGGLPVGWWSALELPGPRDQKQTGSVETAAGLVVPIHNGGEVLDDLVGWGFDQFEAAGLAEPRIDSVTFEPSRTCEGVSGRIVENPDSRDLVLCFYEDEVCPDPTSCVVFSRGARIAMLHELGHAWLLDQIDGDTRNELLALSGRSEWDSQAVSWGRRGVEYSAHILAWGISEEDLPLIELGEPPCAEAEAAFRLLTSTQAVLCSLPS